MNIIYQIMSWLYDTLVSPISDFFSDSFVLFHYNTPISITMPGSNTVMFTATLADLFMITIAILVFIGSICILVGIVKLLYKMGKSLFGGRR